MSSLRDRLWWDGQDLEVEDEESVLSQYAYNPDQPRDAQGRWAGKNVPESLSPYLEMVARTAKRSRPDWKYGSIEEFVLRNGERFTEHEDVAKSDMGPKKQCYKNAVMFVSSHEGYDYAEGYVTVHSVPIAHAWAVNQKTGKIADNTLGNDPITKDYFGVRFKPDFAIKTVLRRGLSGVIDNPEEGFPLLTGKAKKFTQADLTWTKASELAEWDESKHPRDKQGQFAPSDAVDATKSDEPLEKLGEKITPKQFWKGRSRKDLSYYTKEAYWHVNNQLRSVPIEGLDDSTREFVDSLDSLFLDARTQAPAVVYRALGAYSLSDEFKGLKEGDIMVDKAFVSTTLDPSYDFGTAPNMDLVRARIFVPAGSKAVYLGGKIENEVLLNRGSRFRVGRRWTKTEPSQFDPRVTNSWNMIDLELLP